MRQSRERCQNKTWRRRGLFGARLVRNPSISCWNRWTTRQQRETGVETSEVGDDPSTSTTERGRTETPNSGIRVRRSVGDRLRLQSNGACSYACSFDRSRARHRVSTSPQMVRCDSLTRVLARSDGPRRPMTIVTPPYARSEGIHVAALAQCRRHVHPRIKDFYKSVLHV